MNLENWEWGQHNEHSRKKRSHSGPHFTPTEMHIHASCSLEHASGVREWRDLCMREVGVFLHAAQLFDLQVCQLHLLLGVNHFSLQLCKGLWHTDVRIAVWVEWDLLQYNNFYHAHKHMLKHCLLDVNELLQRYLRVGLFNILHTQIWMKVQKCQKPKI